MRWLAVIMLAAALAIGACALLDDGPPENECEIDADCFRAQGEVCNDDTNMCEPQMDAGVDAP